MTYELDQLPQLLSDLYAIVTKLEAIAPGRKFTPDGHLVGSIGEAVAAYAYGLELLPASEKRHDARASDGRCVQIKLTQGRSVALSYDCDFLLVLQLDRAEGFIEIYNGPGSPVWAEIASKADIGRQRQISLSRLRAFPRAAATIERQRPFPAFLPILVEGAVTRPVGDDPTITPAVEGG